jgi:signal transduction histidine kinase
MSPGVGGLRGRIRPRTVGAAIAQIGAVALTIRAALAATASAPADSTWIVGVALDLLVCWAFVITGILMARRRPTDRAGALAVLTGLAWGLSGIVHRGPLVQLLLSDPAGRRLSRIEIAIVAFAWADGVLGTFVRLDVATVILATVIVAVTVARVARSTGVVRRSRIAPAIAAGLVAAALLGGAVPALRGVPPIDGLVALYELVLVAVAVGLALDRLAGRWSAAAATGLVVDLGSRAIAGSLRDRLAEALGDRGLIVGFVDRDGALVDEAGVRIDPPPPEAGRVTTTITSDGVVLAALIHDPAVLVEGDLAETVRGAMLLTIGNVRLRAEIQQRAAEVDASRRRIVRAGYEQRLRMERALLAGPAHRLDTVASLVREAVGDGVAEAGGGREGDVGADVADLLAELEDTRRELQRFARAVYPPALAERDLRGAIADLAARTDLPIDVEVAVGAVPPILETTFWFVCSEALANIVKHAGASRATISIRASAGRLHMEIADDGVGGVDGRGAGLRGLVDRVEAVGGTVDIVSRRGAGTRLTIDAPLDPDRERGPRPVDVSRAPA